MSRDLLDWIRTELKSQPAALAQVDPVLNAARQTWGGERVYLPRRSPEQRQHVTRRTLQRRQARPA